MTVVQDHARDVFVAAGLVAHDAGALPGALAELAIRLDLAGAGDLVQSLCEVSFAPDCDDTCRYCGAELKHPPGDPKPPPPPPPPPPEK